MRPFPGTLVFTKLLPLSAESVTTTMDAREKRGHGK